MKRLTTVILVLAGLLVIGMTNFAMAADTDPAPPQTITEVTNEVFNASNYASITWEAEAGNVTGLTIFGVSPTIHWQGWYGNITATIVLEDAQGNTFYNWSSAEPQGEIYASTNSSIAWDNVTCFNHTGAMNYTVEETRVDIEKADSDGINNTFNETDHPEFWIGATSMTGCPTAWPFVNDDAQSARFPNVLLEAESSSASVYATIIENRDDGATSDVPGFDGGTMDFQMLVPENGTLGNIQSTTYYFWVQLS